MHIIKIGEIIKERRGVLRLTQKHLSELSEIGLKTIIMIENGEANPSVNTLIKILDVLGLELDLKTKELS